MPCVQKFVEEYIGKKSFRAKGKKVSWMDVKDVRFVEPLVKSAAEQDTQAATPSLGVDEPDEPNWSNPDEPTLF